MTAPLRKRLLGAAGRGTSDGDTRPNSGDMTFEQAVNVLDGYGHENTHGYENAIPEYQLLFRWAEFILKDLGVAVLSGMSPRTVRRCRVEGHTSTRLHDRVLVNMLPRRAWLIFNPPDEDSLKYKEELAALGRYAVRLVNKRWDAMSPQQRIKLYRACAGTKKRVANDKEK